MKREIFKIKKVLTEKEEKIKFFILIFLLVFLSFGLGNLSARYQSIKPLEIESFIN